MIAKLDSPETAPKTYWSIISRFLNTIKIPIIPPILVNGKLLSDFQEKSNLFNNHFTAQGTPIQNTSKLPNFKHKTDKRLTSLEINEDDMLLIIKILNLYKAHGWDNLSTRMIKICSKSLTLLLNSIFNSMPPKDWKKSIVVSFIKRLIKNIIKNY